jgi:pimeloyl-ACP methyl ester carboxylesterase
MMQRYGSARRNACRALAVLGTASAGCALADTPPQSAGLTPITWEACAPGMVDDRWIAAMGNRLECGSMLTALDEDVPSRGTFTVGLIRLKAGSPRQREGSIFFNFGGPGANPLQFLPPTGYLWSTRSADHPIDGDKRRLADRFDLVAVIPRGLRGGTRYACRPSLEEDIGHDPAILLADWNWVGFVREARAYASACEDPLQPFVGTLQHVRDMERVRRALGEPVMNFVGISYGSWVGAFYAATYPSHAGRIVLDSVMNFAGTFEDQVGAFPAERQALFARYALRPALAHPLLYGIGSDAKATMARFRAMPHQARHMWASVISAPSHLVAALTLADWMRGDGDPTSERLIARAQSYVFSTDPATDQSIREAARELASRIGQNEDPTLGGLVDLSVYHAVICGDSPWRKDQKALRSMANEIGARYPAANGGPVMTGLTCLHWSAQPRWRPALTELAKAPPLLMIQAEFDPATPYTGAMQAFNASPGAYMVVARGARSHGLFGASATPCVEHAVGRFLLTGERPATPLSMCDYVPSPVSPEARQDLEGPSEREVRAELVQRLRNI